MLYYASEMHRGGAIRGRQFTPAQKALGLHACEPIGVPASELELEAFVAAERDSGATGGTVSADAFAAKCRLLAGDGVRAVILAEQALGRARSLGGMHSATPLLHRIRGEALIALGRRSDGLRALRRSLDAARLQHADDEVAFTLTAMLDAGAAGTAYQHAEWRTERDRLARQLGIAI